MLDNPYINYLINLIDLNDFWFYEIENKYKYGGAIEWTLCEWNENIENDKNIELNKFIYWEMENLTEQQRKDYFKTRSYGHPSAIMWRKFYFDVIKPNFL